MDSNHLPSAVLAAALPKVLPDRIAAQGRRGFPNVWDFSP